MANKKGAKTKKSPAKKAKKHNKTSKKLNNKVKLKVEKKATPGKKQARKITKKIEIKKTKTIMRDIAAIKNWQEFFVPLDDRLLVEVSANPEKTFGGIIIPDSAQRKPNTAKVLSVGPGHRDEKGRFQPMDVKVGEKIVITEMTGRYVELMGKPFLLVRETDVLGVVS